MKKIGFSEPFEDFGSQTLIDFRSEHRLFPSWLLLEKHNKQCKCSYCNYKKTGIVTPEDNGWNSWKSVRWNLFGNHYVVRWIKHKKIC
jgi:hypothetical protein